jgi:DNA-binding NtrC family response regulator
MKKVVIMKKAVIMNKAAALRNTVTTHSADDSSGVSNSSAAISKNEPRNEPDGTIPPVLHHICVDPTGGVPIAQAHLGDQKRLALVLQGAALLAHLEHGGWYLPTGWDEARVDEEGRLRIAGIEQGRARSWSQVQLRWLLERLFRVRDEIPGRGEARRSARQLLSRWRQVLTPAPAEQAVVEILEAAPFLWRKALADARRCLVAEHFLDGKGHLWFVGRSNARRRILAEGATQQELELVLTSERAWDLWDGYRPGDDPRELMAVGQRRRAAAAWRRDPPTAARDAHCRALCLFELGLYSQALEALQGRGGFEARLLRARCQDAVGKLGAAHSTVRRLAAREWKADQTLRLAEVAIRVLGARDRKEEIRSWVDRSSKIARGPLRSRVSLLAAGAAWDCHDLEAMAEHLDGLASDDEGLREPELVDRWHHLRGLLANEVGDGLRAIEHFGTALARDRRRLPPATAGRLWSGLASGRVYADDLPGAERACRHAVRLLSVCEGPIPITLALHNLAEVRLRRGRLEGVESILERSTAFNRHADNRRALVYDLQLWVRLELVQGRPAAALARCSEASDQIDGEHFDPQQTVFEVFAARALGWQGRRREAARRLQAVPPESSSLRELEPEERPALFALAGLSDEARAAAANTRWAPLWSALLAEVQPPTEVWQELDALDPYRAARLIFDCELLRSGVAPPRRVRKASDVLRQVGAESIAEWLENRSLSPWRAVMRYLEKPKDSRNHQEVHLKSLLRGAGYSEARLSFRRRDQEQVLVEGQGGTECLSSPFGDGELILEAEQVDDILRALFVLLQGDLEIESVTSMISGRSRSLQKDGIVGSSGPLIKAMERLDRLARGKLPVLILGESGTGKELAAQRVHLSSQRKAGTFVPVNCAALSESLIQSELFGHTRGAFTGAERERIGVFETASGGTVFLDEIGDLPLDAQGKLLRVLQENEIRRVGESFARKVDIRVVTATHRDLQEMVREGDFRQDLYFRLKVATVSLPSLKERGDDILELAEHFLDLASCENKLALSPEARKILLKYPWPGNIRELKNILDVASALIDGGTIYPENLELQEPIRERMKGDYHQQMENHRRQLVESAMNAANGNQAEAARRMGLSRQALSYLVRQLKISQ